jgi:hypothetical protein
VGASEYQELRASTTTCSRACKASSTI